MFKLPFVSRARYDDLLAATDNLHARLAFKGETLKLVIAERNAALDQVAALKRLVPRHGAGGRFVSRKAAGQ